MAGPLTGANAALGLNILYGANLAIDKHNTANPGCQVQLKPFDTEGDPQKATEVAPQIVDDQYTIGLVGPAFSGETKATGASSTRPAWSPPRRRRPTRRSARTAGRRSSAAWPTTLCRARRSRTT